MEAFGSFWPSFWQNVATFQERMKGALFQLKILSASCDWRTQAAGAPQLPRFYVPPQELQKCKQGSVLDLNAEETHHALRLSAAALMLEREHRLTSQGRRSVIRLNRGMKLRV